MPPEITRLTTQFLKDPTRIEVARPATTAATISQYMARIPMSDPKAKRMALRALIEREGEIGNGIVFCNRKTDVDIVAKSLKKHGFDAAPIHGDLDQTLRMKTLDGFRKGELKLLVASDVAARGLDIPAVSHVFNYDVPFHAEDYVHRIGRTGRAGRTGSALMIVSPADAKALDKVLKLIKQEPEEVSLELDWSLAQGGDERRGARGARGRDRDRERRPSRDDAEKPVRAARRRKEAAPEAVEAEVEVQVQVQAEAPAARPLRRADRVPAGARPEAPRPEAPRPERNERSHRRDDLGPSVVGFGADTPAFLLQSALAPAAKPETAAKPAKPTRTRAPRTKKAG
jgi:superfamily II DNA/RNA helicase